jgi:hypothetical protein
MDQELKQYLDSNFGRIDGRFEAVDKRFEVLEARIEKTETNLLTAFHGWARPMELRVGNMTTIVMGFEERITLAEQRISQLERKRSS